jgi:hypothetical protein
MASQPAAGARLAESDRAFRRSAGLGYHRAVWLLTLSLLACLSIDFSNPLLPGVVRFGDSESVYAVRAERPRTDERASVTSVLPLLGSRQADLVVAVPRATSAAAEQPRPAPVVARARSLFASTASPPSAGDDH